VAEDIIGLFESCSNVGRWGDEGDAGTVNFIAEDSRLHAASLITAGRTVSLAHTLSTRLTPRNNPPVRHTMIDVGERSDLTSMDSMEIACHGVAITHLDALGHMFFEGKGHGGRSTEDIVSASGLTYADVMPFRDGVFTRGVLLDVTRVRGSQWLPPGDGVTVSDLEAAERAAGVRVSRGDAIFVHTGQERLEAAHGEQPPDIRTGLLPECIPWLFHREIAIYSGDCTEQIPSGSERVPYPLHQVGFVAMGLVLLDNPRLSALISTCEELGRFEFALTFAPLPLPGATGSAVNPLALF